MTDTEDRGGGTEYTIVLKRDYILGGDIDHPPATAPIAKRGDTFKARYLGRGYPDVVHFYIGDDETGMDFTAKIGPDAAIVWPKA